MEDGLECVEKNEFSFRDAFNGKLALLEGTGALPGMLPSHESSKSNKK